MSSMTTTPTHTRNDSRTEPKPRPQNQESIKTHVDSLKDDVTQLKDDAVQAASAVGNQIQSQAENVSEFAKSGANKAGEFHKSICDNVSNHPTAAVLLSVGVGVMLGRLLGGR